MKKLIFAALPIALAGSPAISATYSAGGDATGSPNGNYSADTPGSVGGGGQTFGYGGMFGATASNVGGGSVSASASEGISDTSDYNPGTGADGPEIYANVDAAVNYTFQVLGPVRDALIPVFTTMVAHVDALSIPGPFGNFYYPIVAGSGAEVILSYANNGPDLPFVDAGNNYNSQYFTGDYTIAPDTAAHTDSFSQVVMFRADEPIHVLVAANAGTTYGNYGVANGSPSPETAVARASADPTFTIEDPAFADYTIEGVPTGPRRWRRRSRRPGR